MSFSGVMICAKISQVAFELSFWTTLFNLLEPEFYI